MANMSAIYQSAARLATARPARILLRPGTGRWRSCWPSANPSRTGCRRTRNSCSKSARSLVVVFAWEVRIRLNDYVGTQRQFIIPDESKQALLPREPRVIGRWSEDSEEAPLS